MFRALTPKGWLLVAVLLVVAGLLYGAAARAAPVGPPVAHTWPFAPRSAQLLMLMDKAHPAKSSDGRQLWALSADLSYRTHAGDTITVPKGMVTDLASIPRIVQGLLPSDGAYAQAALVHDFLYKSSGRCVLPKFTRARSCSRKADYTRAEADQILDDAMADIGVGAATRITIWTGVRVGGSRGWSH